MSDMLKLLTIVIFFSGLVCASEAKADNSSWMADLDGDTLITRIAIPGTHDSAADVTRCTVGFVPLPYCTAQKYGFIQQLSKGIRFFDIRLAYENDDLRFYHNIYPLRLGFKEVIDVVQKHLTDYSTEFVIFLIKQEHTSVSADTFWQLIYKQISDYPAELFYTSEDGVPPVEKVRGKIVMMAREKPSNYPDSPPYQVAWENNTVHYEGHDGHLKYVVEDHWSLATVGTDTKFAQVAQNLYLAGLCADTCCDPNTLFITHLSGTGAKLPPDGPEPVYYAAYENPKTADWLHDHPGPRPGIVVMDFAGDPDYDGDRLIEEVIQQNW